MSARAEKGGREVEGEWRPPPRVQQELAAAAAAAAGLTVREDDGLELDLGLGGIAVLAREHVDLALVHA